MTISTVSIAPCSSAAAAPRPAWPWRASCSFASLSWSAIRLTTPSSAGAAVSRRARPSTCVPHTSSTSLARTRGRAQPFQRGCSRSDRWSPVTDSLFETPPLDDPGSSTIERDIMRRWPCANGWLVDRCPGPETSELVLDVHLVSGATTVLPAPRSTILRQLCDRIWRDLGAERRRNSKDTLDATAVLMDRSPDPPAAGATAGSSGRGPWRLCGSSSFAQDLVSPSDQRHQRRWRRKGRILAEKIRVQDP